MIAIKTEIIFPAFHHDGIDGALGRFTQKGDILKIYLLLKVLGARGDDAFLSAENDGHQVTEGFSRARPRLDNQVPPLRQNSS